MERHLLEQSPDSLTLLLEKVAHNLSFNFGLDFQLQCDIIVLFHTHALFFSVVSTHNESKTKLKAVAASDMSERQTRPSND